ncbi:MAG TPA: hypothetical protein VLM40_08045, partial [Gemmata sp.]|nr:hypothetical protein [Gemmata sp.]
MEQQKFMMTGKYGRQFLPTRMMGVGIAVGGGLFGLFWTIMAFSITSVAPEIGGFSAVKVIFPILGIGLTIGAVVFGIYTLKRADEYDRAFSEYQERRAALKPERADNRS